MENQIAERVKPECVTVHRFRRERNAMTMLRKVAFTIATSSAIVLGRSARASTPHIDLCRAMSGTVLTSGIVPLSSATDDFVRANVCRTLPSLAEANARGLELTYPIANHQLGELWATNAGVAAAAKAAICTATPAPPDPYFVARQVAPPELRDVLDSCLERAVNDITSEPAVCAILPLPERAALFIHHAGTPPQVTAVTTTGTVRVPSTTFPFDFVQGLARVEIGMPVRGTDVSAMARFSNGKSCTARIRARPDIVTTKLVAVGQAVRYVPAQIVDFTDSRGDDCGSNRAGRTRTVCVGPDYRINSTEAVTHTSYSSNCPTGASTIDSIVSLDNSCVAVNYHLVGCGFTKIGGSFSIGGVQVNLSAEWCNGRSWVGETVAIPAVRLDGQSAGEPQDSSAEQRSSPWLSIHQYTVRLPRDFALQSFDWEAHVSYAPTATRPIPRRVASLNAGASMFVDTQEKRCFAGFFSAAKKGLVVVGLDDVSSLGACSERLHVRDNVDELLSLTDPCDGMRSEDGIVRSADAAKVHSDCRSR